VSFQVRQIAWHQWIQNLSGTGYNKYLSHRWGVAWYRLRIKVGKLFSLLIEIVLQPARCFCQVSNSFRIVFSPNRIMSFMVGLNEMQSIILYTCIWIFNALENLEAMLRIVNKRICRCCIPGMIESCFPFIVKKGICGAWCWWMTITTSLIFTGYSLRNMIHVLLQKHKAFF